MRRMEKAYCRIARACLATPHVAVASALCCSMVLAVCASAEPLPSIGTEMPIPSVLQEYFNQQRAVRMNEINTGNNAVSNAVISNGLAVTGSADFNTSNSANPVNNLDAAQASSVLSLPGLLGIDSNKAKAAQFKRGEFAALTFDALGSQDGKVLSTLEFSEPGLQDVSARLVSAGTMRYQEHQLNETNLLLSQIANPDIPSRLFSGINTCIAQAVTGAAFAYGGTIPGAESLLEDILESDFSGGDISAATAQCLSKSSVDSFLNARNAFDLASNGELLTKVLFKNQNTQRWMAEQFGDSVLRADVQGGKGSLPAQVGIRRDRIPRAWKLEEIFAQVYQNRFNAIGDMIDNIKLGDEEGLIDGIAELSPFPGMPVTQSVIDAARTSFRKNKDREQLKSWLAVAVASTIPRTTCQQARVELASADNSASAWERQRMADNIAAVCSRFDAFEDGRRVTEKNISTILNLIEQSARAASDFGTGSVTKGSFDDFGGGSHLQILKAKGDQAG